MPIPKRTPTENKQDFIQRCMRDKQMVSEFPNNRQRYAVCVSKSRK